ncbi:BolA family protein [Legionella impletisoli]|uniref:Regulator of murein genes BolA n=1 Tax=Legionella impletisoli TaxID=343510 RepID=A0A917JUH2_9GAMM|nr:BolA family protein [Legionella impletisoli]GGI85544.1 regulator of murein genes BolA [Legionella impletisoli]
MNRTLRLKTILSEALKADVLMIEDESHRHHVPSNAETHFKATIVSSSFENTTRISRHRLVNALVKHEFDKGLHALSLHLYTPAEWNARSKTVSDSPVCRGGSRHG